NNGNDSFVFANGAVLTGTATGGTGSDTVDMTAYTSNVSVALTAAAASGFSGTSTAATSFAAMDIIRAGSGATNTLHVLASGTWNLNTTQTYASGAGTLTFAGFQILQGGSRLDPITALSPYTTLFRSNNGNDSFVFANGAVLTGTATGGTGS